VLTFELARLARSGRANSALPHRRIVRWCRLQAASRSVGDSRRRGFKGSPRRLSPRGWRNWPPAIPIAAPTADKSKNKHREHSPEESVRGVSELFRRQPRQSAEFGGGTTPDFARRCSASEIRSKSADRIPEFCCRGAMLRKNLNRKFVKSEEKKLTFRLLALRNR